MNRDAIIKLDDGWGLPVSGQKVTRCCIDNEAVRILCLNMIEFFIGEPFSLFLPDGREVNLDPQGDGLSLAPVLRVVRQVISRAVAFDDGRLEILIDDGTKITVPPSLSYEAWSMSGGKNVTIISLPGGGLG